MSQSAFDNRIRTPPWGQTVAPDGLLVLRAPVEDIDLGISLVVRQDEASAVSRRPGVVSVRALNYSFWTLLFCKGGGANSPQGYLSTCFTISPQRQRYRRRPCPSEIAFATAAAAGSPILGLRRTQWMAAR